jgi:hypothetical protein
MYYCAFCGGIISKNESIPMYSDKYICADCGAIWKIKWSPITGQLWSVHLVSR